MVWVEFLEEVVKKWGKSGWFENDRRILSKHMMTAIMIHGKFDPNSSRDHFLPTDPELKLVEITSPESTVGSVLTQRRGRGQRGPLPSSMVLRRGGCGT